MIHLVKHFLRRARPKIALLVSLGAVVWFLGGWIVDCSEIQQAWLPTFMIVAMYAMVIALISEEAGEFDLVLPFPRRTLYVAKNLATLLLTLIMAAPVSATVLAIAAFQSHHWEALRICATFAVCWIAMPLMTVPFVRLAYRTRSIFTILIAALPLIGISTLLITAVWGNISSLVTVVVAVPTAVLAWFLGCWQFDRYELAPSDDAGPAQVAAARSGLIAGC